MTRERVVSIPVVVGGSGGGVGAMLGAIVAVVFGAVLIAVMVELTYPDQPHQPVTDCRPFCSQLHPTQVVGGEQR